MAQNLVLNILAKDKTRIAFRGIQAGLSNLRASIFSVQSALIGIGGGLVVRSFLKVGRDVEELGIRFNFLFGNVKEGQKAFKGLIDFASKVPFSLEEIAQGSGNLAVVAKDAKELNKIMKITGNVAAVTGLDFRTTAEQIQRSFSAGIGAADLFRDRGVKAMLGFKAGATVSIEETIKRFEELFGEDGRFSKATEVLAATFTGTLSMLGDKLFKFKMETNQAGFFDFIKNSLVVVNKIIEKNSRNLQEFSSALGQSFVNFIKQAILGTAALLDLLAPMFRLISMGVGSLIEAIRVLPAGIREMGILGFMMFGTKGKLAIVAITAFLEKMNVDLEKLSKRIFGADTDPDDLTGLFGEANKLIAAIDQSIIDSKKSMKELTEAASNFKDETKKVGISLQKIKDNILESFKKDFESINTTLAKMAQSGIKAFSRGLAEAVVMGKELNMTMKEIAQRLLVDILAFTIQIIIQETIRTVIADIQLKKEQDKLKVLKEQGRELRKNTGLGFVQAGLSLFGFAKGGAVSKGNPVVVGERGPEVFVPNQTGQITQNARGTGGETVNVNFNIEAIDSNSFNDVLVENRGIITSIINNALNEKGRRELV